MAPKPHVEASTSATDERYERICAAAVDQFSRRGFAGTSMANIAEAAGMSRPALYQYFRNKGDIFASAFIALVEAHVAQALTTLERGASVAEQLDGFVQRFEGDLYEKLAASPHAEEIISAKNEDIAAGMAEAMSRLWQGLGDHLEKVSPGGAAKDVDRRADWVDVLHFSPKGFKFDQPSIETYRRRLSALARGVAAEIESA